MDKNRFMSHPVYQTVILGGGFTGLFTALHLAHEHYPRSVILIDSNERFCFKPLLYEYFSGEMDAFQVVPRFTELLKGSGVIFVQDTVQAIDLHQRQVKLTSGTSYNYSNLVLALGSVTGYFGVEGAKEYALPFWTQKDAIAFWIIPPAGILLLSSFLLPDGPAQAGWWSYPPISIQNSSGHLLNGEFVWILSVILLGISSILGGVNFITTIVWMRAPGMTFFRMPLFVWTVLSAQILQLFCLPSLTGALILLFFDLTFGTNFFKPSQNGDPIIYQHLFWFYSHPAVYVMALPTFGIFSEILPAFSRNPLFGYRSVAIASFGTVCTFLSVCFYKY